MLNIYDIYSAIVYLCLLSLICWTFIKFWKGFVYEGHSLVILVGICFYFLVCFILFCKVEMILFTLWEGALWFYMPWVMFGLWLMLIEHNHDFICFQPDSQFTLYQYDFPFQHLTLLLKWVNWSPSHMLKGCCILILKLAGDSNRKGHFPSSNLSCIPQISVE